MQTELKGVTPQTKVLDEYILIVLLLSLLKRVHSLEVFRLGQKNIEEQD